jgi:glyoxylate/succinic semialdehyde reductase
VSGSKKPAIDGQLIILAAGDEELFKECAAAFDIMVRTTQGCNVTSQVS